MRCMSITTNTNITAIVAKVKEVIAQRLSKESAARRQNTFLAAAQRGYLETKGGCLAVIPIISRCVR